MSVTLYKTCISINCRMEDSVIDSYLNKCESMTIADCPAIQPNVPFFMTLDVSKYNFIDLQSYNYLTTTVGGKTYYAFILSINQTDNGINAAEGYMVVRVSHIWDIVALFGTKLFDSPDGPVTGTLNRGHVNDMSDSSISYTGSCTLVPSCKNYLLDQEEPLSEGAIIRERIQAATSSPVGTKITVTYPDPSTASSTITVTDCEIIGYLYLFINNLAGIFKDTDRSYMGGKSGVYDNTDGAVLPSQGACFQVYVTKNSGDTQTNPCLVVWPTANGGSTYNGCQITNLTNSYLTSMFFSRYNLNRMQSATTFVTLTGDDVTGLPDKAWLVATYNGSYSYVFDSFDAFNSVYKEKEFSLYSERTSGYTIITDALGFRHKDISPIGIASTFSNYLRRYIVKLHTAPYCGVTVDGSPVISLYWSGDLTVEYNADMSGYQVYSNWGNALNAAEVISTTNTSLMAPSAAIDYWTRLNAEQESIQAQKGKANAITSMVMAPIQAVGQSLGGAGMMAATGSMAGLGQITSGVTNLVSTEVSAAYDIGYYENMAEQANHQYQAGETLSNTPAGSVCARYNQNFPEVMITHPTEQAAQRLAYSLHLRGYDTSIPLNQLYFHKRRYFNYIQSSDYYRTDIPLNVLQEFQKMFKQGAWIFTNANIENDTKFNVINVQCWAGEE